MENRKNEQMIYLKDLIFAALYQWKKLLIAAVALAVLLGGFQGITGLINLKDPDTLEAITKQNQIQQERYEAEVDSLKKQIETLRAQVRSQQEYLDNSLLMQLQPYNFYEASLVLYIDAGYQILPGMEYQNPNQSHAVIKAYESLLLGNDCLQSMADAMDTEPRYLKELITIDCNYESESTDVNVLQITAKAPTQEQAQQLLELLTQQIAVQQQKVSASVGSHSYRIVEQATREAFDLALADQQKAENDRLTTLLANQTAAQTSQSALTPPSLQSDSGKAVLKKAVIFAVVGAVLAVFLGVVILWVSHIASGKVYSCRTLLDRTGIKILGAVLAANPKTKLDRLLACWEGRDVTDPQVKSQLLAASVRNLAEGSSLLITGGADAQARQLLTEAIAKAMPQTTVTDAGDILNDLPALEALPGFDAVLLLEQCQVSRYADVNRRIELIRDYNKQLLGCVVYGG